MAARLGPVAEVRFLGDEPICAKAGCVVYMHAYRNGKPLFRHVELHPMCEVYAKAGIAFPMPGRVQP